MKNILSVALVSLCVTSSALVGSAQKGPEPPKPNASPAEQSAKNQNSAAALSSNTTVPTADTPVKTDSASAPSLTDIYRVGIGDILDVRLLNSTNAAHSTLFTVVAGGMIDIPVAGGPVMVAGLTTEEIQAKIGAELNRRAVGDNGQISVGVRQYASHSVLVTGLVASPGTRILRREAVPLYVVLAESQLRNDAGRVAIIREGSTGNAMDLSDPQTLNATVMHGDVITLSARPQEFYYIAGKINYPGQKTFQPGITLTQVILAAGGTARGSETKVEISREGTDGRLVTTRFSLKEIKAGAVEDPRVRPGDRIEVLK